MSKQQDKGNELYPQKKQNSLSAAEDNPETDFYENPIKKPVQMAEDEDKANEDPA
ncbi:MAG TPA: hypothetical protein VJM74_02470 [Nitrososphaeraceae archaeon]|nr:hypothetical protein [Nitrososphaeraceae archaeon]